MKHIVIFASGSGSNAQRIAEYFSSGNIARVVKIYSNRADAYVLERAKNLDISFDVFDRTDLYETDVICNQLNILQPDVIVLAGFLWKIPEDIIQAFPKKIVNIHPALLPAYGGKGMYGERVHRMVIENREPESGITIHYVNEKYDEGAAIFQARCSVSENDTPETLAEKIHVLEHKYYPVIIERVLLQR